jgi:hypothetical protein
MSFATTLEKLHYCRNKAQLVFFIGASEPRPGYTFLISPASNVLQSGFYLST